MTKVSDLNGDGKLDDEDLKIAVAEGKRIVGDVVDETARLAKAAARSDLAREVGTFAAVGAAIAIPLPIVGPTVGAAAGAALGLYRHVTKTATPSFSEGKVAPEKDLHAELLKLDDLRQKGLLTEEEFSAQKSKLLRGV